MTLTVSSLGERALIDRITARLATPPWVVVGPGDDAAVIEPERGALDVLTTDALVEGIHFERAFVPDGCIGHRALAVNLSDLAAMGARPRAALLSLMLPDTLSVAALDGIVEGLTSLAAREQVALVGGNITRSPGALVLGVTATGAVGRRRILQRSGALPGDEVFVTGTIGDAGAGLQMLRADAGTANRCTERYLRPDARTRAGWLLGANRAATSCVDLSDGLADGTWQLAGASGAGIAIDGAAVPLSDVARAWFERTAGAGPLHAAITAGDDYELLFTVRPSHRGRLRGVRRLLGDLPVTKIGVVTKNPGVTIDGTPMPGGYEHFGGSEEGGTKVPRLRT